MIFAFSTSCAVASVAVFDPTGQILFEGARESQQEASSTCLTLLTESGFDVMKGTLFLADIGPGSFTGTRVGVVLAKTLAYLASGMCAGATAFDLISADRTVVFPSKRGEWFVREVGGEVKRQTELSSGDFVGFGPGMENQTFPLASRFAPLLARLTVVSPMEFVPEYLIEPSISTPKNPFSMGAA